MSQRKILSSNLWLLESETIFSQKIILYRKKNVMDLCLATVGLFVVQWLAKMVGGWPQLKPLHLTVAIHQQKYFDTYTKWRCLMLDSSELLESQVPSCWKSNIYPTIYVFQKNGKQLHINNCLADKLNNMIINSAAIFEFFSSCQLTTPM